MLDEFRRCEECRFWRVVDKVTAGYSVGEGFGTCSSPKWIKDFELPKGSWWKRIPIDGVITEYDDEWGFLTGRRFGCIHVEEAIEDSRSESDDCEDS